MNKQYKQNKIIKYNHLKLKTKKIKLLGLQFRTFWYKKTTEENSHQKQLQVDIIKMIIGVLIRKNRTEELVVAQKPIKIKIMKLYVKHNRLEIKTQTTHLNV